ncbi:MAG: 3-oxoacyl-[acyl-carrier-protein] reductase [SAR202 cluster bacterium]|nr:3-oxoacyl-[acyl-carrier-protein] reductase [SAR202 cluster bacterium]
MPSLAGKRALVTGGGTGIGRAISLRLAKDGAAVAVNYARSKDAAEEVARLIGGEGGKALALAGDISVAADADGIVQRAIEELGGLDILVNNAGVTKDNLLLRMSEADWDSVIDTNLKGTFLVTKAAVRHMLRQRAGRVINMSSVVALTGNPGQANYTAAKAGLIGFTKTVAREVASRGITVNAIAPGFIATRMVEGLAQDVVQRIMERIPLARFGSPDEVAATVAFLAGDGAGYITGQTISIDGGLGL